MSLNTAHVNGGVLIHAGEAITLFSDNVSLKFSGVNQPEFQGKKNGRIYLTTHRVIFNSKSQQDAMLSFSFPFVTLRNMNIEQPVFGANYVSGTVVAQPNGNWVGQANFKMVFNNGGAIEFGQALLRVSSMTQTNYSAAFDSPPPYEPPQSGYYAAPPPAYSAAPNGYYGWVPPTQAFPQQPPDNSVFMTESPPPYPGIVPGSTPFNSPPQQQSGFQTPNQPQYPQIPQNNNQQYPQSNSGYPQQYPQGYTQGNQGFSHGGPPSYPQGGFSAYPQVMGPGYPQSGQGYPQGAPGYPQNFPGGNPQGNPGYPQQQYPGYPPNMPSDINGAHQNAYYLTNDPHVVFVTPSPNS